MEHIQGIQINIAEKKVLRLLGYRRQNYQPEGKVTELLRQEIEKAYHLIKPKAIYTEVPAREVDKYLIGLDEGLTLEVGQTAIDWRGLEYLGISICTIGTALESRVSELFQRGEYPAALMLDSVGSVATDSIADYINYVICQRAQDRGINVGPRLSPGYGKWKLTEQQKLFSLLPGEEIGVQLNQQCMMIPRKSVSFCVGMGQGIGRERSTNPCRRCGMASCPYRRPQAIV